MALVWQTSNDYQHDNRGDNIYHSRPASACMFPTYVRSARSHAILRRIISLLHAAARTVWPDVVWHGRRRRHGRHGRRVGKTAELSSVHARHFATIPCRISVVADVRKKLVLRSKNAGAVPTLLKFFSTSPRNRVCAGTIYKIRP